MTAPLREMTAAAARMAAGDYAQRVTATSADEASFAACHVDGAEHPSGTTRRAID